MTNPTPHVSAWRSTRRTLILVLGAWLTTAVIAAVSYLALGHLWVPIAAGCLLAMVFVVCVGALHKAAWLAVLSLAPGVFVLIGAVQFAPETALEQRGVSETVTLMPDEAASSAKRHVYRMRTDDGRELDQEFVYSGSNSPYRTGQRLQMVVDPEGVVDPEEATKVDPAEERANLIGGATGWTVIALLAGWRGHVRRRTGRTRSPLATVLDAMSV